MQNAIQQDRIITWNTTKNGDGTFTGTCYTFTSIKQAVEGRHVTPYVTLHTCKAHSRAVAKAGAIKACRYYKHVSSAAVLEAKLAAACPAKRVTDATPSL